MRGLRVRSERLPPPLPGHHCPFKGKPVRGSITSTAGFNSVSRL